MIRVQIPRPALWLGVLLSASCGAGAASTDGDGGEAAEAAMHGVELATPIARPAFSLTDTDGNPYSFREQTEGKLALLFIGFTHCPDVCPVHMANLGAVLRDFPYEMRERVEVVFVSADPQRDTAERIREWLDAFDPRFVGLRGSTDDVNALLAQLDMAPAVIGAADAQGDYSVGHPAQIIAFSPDGPARYVYPFGTRQADWAHDLPLLLEEAPIDAPQPPRIVASGNALVPRPAGDGPAALYVTLRNVSERDEALVGASTRVAERVGLHGQVGSDGSSMMTAMDELALAAGDSLRLRPGGAHLMLSGLERELQVGDTFTVELKFRSGAREAVRALVVPYSMLEALN